MTHYEADLERWAIELANANKAHRDAFNRGDHQAATVILGQLRSYRDKHRAAAIAYAENVKPTAKDLRDAMEELRVAHTNRSVKQALIDMAMLGGGEVRR